MTRTRFQKFPTHTQELQSTHRYTVCFTSDLFGPDNETIRRTLTKMGHKPPLRCAVLVDSGVAARNAALIPQILHHFQKERPFLDLCHPPFAMPGGESVKNSRRTAEAISAIARTHALSRESLVLVVGGGAFLDAAGTALSQCDGGIPTANIPTSPLAQSAAGIGAMRFMNEGGIKNAAGIFAPPHAVFIDFALLKTLPFEHHVSGMAEAFKMALAADAEFFAILCRKALKIRQNDRSTVEKVIHKTATLHLDQARKSYARMAHGDGNPADFGDWTARWLETLSGYKLPHGHALSVGIALKAWYGCHTGTLAEGEFTRLIEALLTCGLPIWNRFLETRTKDGTLALTEGLTRYQNGSSGHRPILIPVGVGTLKAVDHLDVTVFEQGIDLLKQLSGKERSPERRIFMVSPGRRQEKNEGAERRI